MRKVYLEALLRQDIGWYDTVQDKSFVSGVSEDIGKVQEAGEKLGLCIYHLFMSVICFTVSLYYGWLLTLIVTPVFGVVGIVVSSLQDRMTVQEQKAYTKSGSIAQEVLANIKTVMAFSGQRKEFKHYDDGSVFALTAGKKRGLVAAIGNGTLWFFNYASQALALWYGIKLILDGERTCGTDSTFTSQNLII
ncbi:unnamed protein product, partial [Allacma fusca]